MARYDNPMAYSRYPTDPSFAMIGQNLGRALFGDPELRAKAQLQRAQMEELAAQAERARAGAGLDVERTRGVRGQNDTVYGTGDGSLAGVITDPAALAFLRAHPEGATMEALNKMRAGGYLTNIINGRVAGGAFPTPAPVAAPQPAPTPLAAAVASQPVPMPPPATSADEITVTARKPVPVAPPVLPKLDEQTLRLIGALQGDMPSETTSYTPEYGLLRQSNALNNDVKLENIRSADRRRGQNIESTDRRRGQNISSQDTRRGQDIDSSDKRRGQDMGSDKPLTKVTADETSSIENGILDKFPDISDADLAKAVEYGVNLYQKTGNMQSAINATNGYVKTKPGKKGKLPFGLSDDAPTYSFAPPATSSNW